MGLKASIVTDEQEARARNPALRIQELDEFAPGVFVQRRGRFVRKDQLRGTDQRPRCRDALLLPDAQFR